jgi:hypothetical protein
VELIFGFVFLGGLMGCGLGGSAKFSCSIVIPSFGLAATGLFLFLVKIAAKENQIPLVLKDRILIGILIAVPIILFILDVKVIS